MSQTQTPYRSPMAWPAFIVGTASLCFSLWGAIYRTPPQGLLARYALVFLGLSIVGGTTANLLAPSSRLKKWLLLVFVWVCLAASAVGLYLKGH